MNKLNTSWDHLTQLQNKSKRFPHFSSLFLGSEMTDAGTKVTMYRWWCRAPTGAPLSTPGPAGHPPIFFPLSMAANAQLGSSLQCTGQGAGITEDCPQRHRNLNSERWIPWSFGLPEHYQFGKVNILMCKQMLYMPLENFNVL